MGEFVTVAKVSEIPENGGRVVTAQGRTLALFKVGGNVHVIDNTCVHRGGPLGEGEVSGMIVTCPWHGWEYDVATGENPLDPSLKVERFEVRVEGDAVQVGL